MSYSGTRGYVIKPKPGVMLNPLHPLSRGLLGCWLFNEGSGSQAKDISGCNNHGVCNSLSWSDNDLIFGSQLECPDILSLISKYTILLDLTTTSSAISCPFTHEFTTNWRSTVQFNYVGNNRWITRRDGSATADSLNFDTFSQGEHAEYVFVHDTVANTKTVYKDGEYLVSASAAHGAGVLGDGNTTWFGHNGDGQDWAGAMHRAAIYNRALTAAEVKQMYNTPFGNLLRVPLRRYYIPAVGGVSIPVLMDYYKQLRRN